MSGAAVALVGLCVCFLCAGVMVVILWGDKMFASTTTKAPTNVSNTLQVPGTVPTPGGGSGGQNPGGGSGGQNPGGGSGGQNPGGGSGGQNPGGGSGVQNPGGGAGVNPGGGKVTGGAGFDANAGLAYINKKRAEEGLPPFHLDAGLMASAQSWAERAGTPRHSGASCECISWMNPGDVGTNKQDALMKALYMKWDCEKNN